MHIHAPGTALNDQFKGGIEEFVKTIENHEVPAAVLGITDYKRINCYKEIRRLKADGRLTAVAMILPNIEFRIGPWTKESKGINIHLLISPDDPEHVTKIEEALSRLSFTFREQPFPCTDKGFRELGNSLKNHSTNSNEALVEGICQSIPDFRVFKEWRDKEKWLKDNSLVAVDLGRGDGTSGLAHDDSFGATRLEIERYADLIFSGNPNDRKHFLGQNKEDREQIIAKYGRLKPCIHGCDAHDNSKILNPDEDRLCWIKADPTFEGLKQIIYEPEDRVFIGRTPPDERYPDRVIKKITLNRAPNWYGLRQIELNSGYVAIIGNKGSGKTALADMIAYAAGAWDSQDKTSFIKKTGKEISGVEIELEWMDGHKSKNTIDPKDYTATDIQVRYLSQQFVEALCSEDRLGDSLRHEIEKVVFSHISPTETLGASNFSELRKKKTYAPLQLIEEAKAKLSKEIMEYINCLDEIDSKEEKLQRKARLQNDINNIKKDMPAQDKKSEDLTNKITEIREIQTSIINKISTQKQNIETIKVERTKLKKFADSIAEQVMALKQSLGRLGVSEKANDSLPKFDVSLIEAELNDKSKDMASKIIDLTGEAVELDDAAIQDIISDKTSLAVQPLSVISYIIQSLEKRETEDAEKRRKINKSIKDIQELQAKIKAIEVEIKRTDEETATKKEKCLSNISSLYQNIFWGLEQEKRELELLYDPLKSRLSGGADHEKRLAFYIQRHVAHKNWCERGCSIFDARKLRQTLLGSCDDLIERVEKDLLEAWQNSELDKALRVINELLVGLEAGKGFETFLKSSYEKKDVYEWLFSTDHIKLNYGMKYDGVALEKLSPGTKGIILLMLYLEMDKSDNRPLIVDQPEENLDNESVFNILTQYFRSAKRRRQIIVITHNPNLVVNTDADQVIVSESREEKGLNVRLLSYISGSIENTYSAETALYPGIREKVCNILEGGEIAFATREMRYAMKH